MDNFYQYIFRLRYVCRQNGLYIIRHFNSFNFSRRKKFSNWNTKHDHVLLTCRISLDKLQCVIRHSHQIEASLQVCSASHTHTHTHTHTKLQTNRMFSVALLAMWFYPVHQQRKSVPTSQIFTAFVLILLTAGNSACKSDGM